MKNSKLFLAIIFCALINVKFSQIYAQKSINEAKIEAIIQLTKFTDWSQNRTFSDSKRMIYVVTDNFTKMELESKSINNSSFKNWQIKYCNNLNEIESGSVIFITNSKQEIATKVIKLSKTMDILTISDNLDNFCQNGGMINLYDHGNQVQFEINYQIIQNKSLEISSKVLALAKIYD